MLINNSADLHFLAGWTHNMDKILLYDLNDCLQTCEHNLAPWSAQFFGLLAKTAEERESIIADCSGHFHVLIPSNCTASSAACFITAEAASKESEVSSLRGRAGNPTCC